MMADTNDNNRDISNSIVNDIETRVQKLVDIMEKKKAQVESKYKSIKYNPVKPKTCTYETPIMQDLFPRVELAK